MSFSSNVLDLLNSKYENKNITFVGDGIKENSISNYLDSFNLGIAGFNKFISNNEIHKFIKRFDHILVHFDIDVLDEHFFHSTYFANSELVGDGAGGGKMTIEKLTEILRCITDNSDIVGFTIAEYLPFDEHKLYKMLTEIKLFTE